MEFSIFLEIIAKTEFFEKSQPQKLGNKITLEIVAPEGAMGKIIGKGGTMINSIMAETDVQIKNNKQTFTVIGSPKNVNLAVSRIRMIIKSHTQNQKKSKETVTKITCY